MSACVIVNPGSREGEELLQIDELHELLAEVSIRRTQHARHATEIAAEAVEAGFDTVVAAGGDGTVNEVVNGLVGHLDEVVLGILPLGTGNDLARTLGIPMDFRRAMEVIAAAFTEACDLVRVQNAALERYMVNASAAGFSGEVGERLTSEMKRAWGPFAYLRAALESLSERKEYELEVEFDDGERLEVTAVNLVVANGRYVAAGVPVAPQADLTDGRVDVLIIRGGTVVELAGLGPRILAGSHLDEADGVDGVDERLVFRQVTALSVMSEPPMPLNVDGELIGPSPATFEVLPRALEVLVDPEGFQRSL